MRSKFKWTLALLMALIVQVSFAQEKTLSGVVTESGIPLPGATVIVKGTQHGTQTDLDGRYTLKVNPGDVLVFSFIGLNDVTYTVGTANSYNASMVSDDAMLEEVVVTAYGTQTKSSIAGSIGVVKADEIAKSTSGNAVQSVAGKVAGVQVVANNGMPGEAPVVRFRGVGSIQSSSGPLYVVDGVPYSGDVASISSNDIESMSFLKDASAAALYGNRGANGVIIITTKKGKQGDNRISLTTKVGITQRGVKEYNMMKSPKEYYEGYNQILRNAYLYGDNGLTYEEAAQLAAQDIIEGEQGLGYNTYNVPNGGVIDPLTGKLNPNAKLLYQEDWDDYLFREGVFTQTHLSISGGNEKSNHLFAIGHEKNDGFYANAGFERITAKLNLEANIKERFKVGANVNYANLNRRYLDGYKGGTTYSSPFFWTRRIAPIYPVHAYDAQGKQVFDDNNEAVYDDGTGEYTGNVRPFGALQNPYATGKYDYKRMVSDNVFATGFFEAKIVKGLTFKYVLTGDLTSSKDKSMDTPLYGDAVTPNGRVEQEDIRTMSFTNQQLLNYNKWFGDHSVDVLLGHESLERTIDDSYLHRTNMLFPDSQHINHAAVLVDGTSGFSPYALEGYFARLNYGYANKYFVNASIRRDASSRFAPENRWGTFFGVGGAWVISDENFLKNVSWLDNLKLKGSYGEQGNDNLLDLDGISLVNPYQDRNVVITTFDPDVPISIDKKFTGNRDITWETNRNTNFGFEGSLFSNRFNLEVEYFERKVSDMLTFRPESYIGGSGGYRPFNIGDMENKGIEISVDGDIIRNKDIRLNLYANFTSYKNKVTKLDGGRDIPKGLFLYSEGKPLYNYYLREFVGVNPENGNAQFKGIDEDTGEDVIVENGNLANLREVNYSAIPKMYGGFGLRLEVKQFDFGVDFVYQLGGYGYDSGYMGALSIDPGQNIHRDLADTWSESNKTASLPRVDLEDPNNFYLASTLGLIKSDYLSLQNLSLGYTLKDTALKFIGLDHMRMYASVDNVGMWSKRQGYDPRLSFTGASDSNKYSVFRTISFGVNLQF